jgi:uroporphyrin-3 C-methyltransferase
MANSNEEPKNIPEIKPEPNMEKTSGNKSFLTAGAVILALASLGTSIYTLSLNQQLQNQLTDKNNLLAAQLDKVEQKQDKTQEQIEAKANTLEETRASLQTKFDGLNKQLQTAMSQKLYQNQNWQLLKARYYLELAQINAHWSKNFSSTVALLQQADQLLQQINDPKIFDIRQAIAKDIAQLQALPKIDVAGILSQLDAAQNSLNELNVPSMVNDEKPEATETPTATKGTMSVWRLRLQDSMNVLSKLVVIRRNDENIKPLVSPAFEALLKENIHLNLQEAQWAVLNGNSQVYQLVLNQAITTLRKNFNEGAQYTAALIKKLTELQQVQLMQKKPEIGLALPLLNQLIQSKEPVVKQTSSDEQGGNAQ